MFRSFRRDSGWLTLLSCTIFCTICFDTNFLFVTLGSHVLTTYMIKVSIVRIWSSTERILTSSLTPMNRTRVNIILRKLYLKNLLLLHPAMLSPTGSIRTSCHVMPQVTGWWWWWWCWCWCWCWYWLWWWWWWSIPWWYWCFDTFIFIVFMIIDYISSDSMMLILFLFNLDHTRPLKERTFIKLNFYS